MKNWQLKLKNIGALWNYVDGEPHVATMLSGQHADSYFNTDVVRDNEELLNEMITDLLETAKIITETKPNYILTFAPFGVPPAKMAGRLLNVPVAIADPASSFAINDPIQKGDKLLAITDDVYTGGSILKSIASANAMGGVIEPIILCFSNNSGLDMLDGRKIISLINLVPKLFPANNCPMCQAGPKALNPRELGRNSVLMPIKSNVWTKNDIIHKS